MNVVTAENEKLAAKIGLTEGQFRKMTKAQLVEHILGQQQVDNTGAVDDFVHNAPEEVLFTALCDRIAARFNGKVPHCMFFDRNWPTGRIQLATHSAEPERAAYLVRSTKPYETVILEKR